MAEYTPRTRAEVSNTWAVHRGRVEQTNDLRPFHAEFDRWLAAHDAALLAEHPASAVAQETVTEWGVCWKSGEVLGPIGPAEAREHVTTRQNPGNPKTLLRREVTRTAWVEVPE